jgi:hypothetical protein
MVTWLLKHGAEPGKAAADGLTPEIMARANRHFVIAETLRLQTSQQEPERE